MTFIGVSFMMGLMSTRRIMIESVDEYYDKYRFQDIQLVSQFGFCSEDISELSKLNFVERLHASKFQDVYARKNGSENEMVLRFTEAETTVNEIELTDGRMPEKFNEILYCPIGTINNTVKVGDTITVYLKDDEVRDHLKSAHYKVVGIVKSPEHMAKFSTTSNLNNLDLTAVCYGMNDIFLNEYYSSVYLTVKNAARQLSFSDGYEYFIEKAVNEIEELAENQESFHRDNLLEKYQAELDEGKAEFEKQKEEGQSQLDDAKKQLDEAQIKIVSLETDLELMNYVIDEAQTKVNGINS
ncbi:MAG: hypothetical protein KIG23_04605, partial [Erysipelotrichaceae bacterium]|nr:hypothetical protein [Erysipelotrichaceae bacterium]